MKKNSNKLIIGIIFLIIIILIYIFNFNDNTKEISEEKAKELIIKALSNEDIEKLEGKSLVVSETKNYMIMVVNDEYLLLDKSKTPPKIHHYKSVAPEIRVKVLEIKEDRFLVEHDDHTHWIEGSPGENVKVGDYVYIKDPHTYLQGI